MFNYTAVLILDNILDKFLDVIFTGGFGVFQAFLEHDLGEVTVLFHQGVPP